VVAVVVAVRAVELLAAMSEAVEDYTAAAAARRLSAAAPWPGVVAELLLIKTTLQLQQVVHIV